MSQNKHTISLPAIAVDGTPGTLNCVSADPLYGLVKNFRKMRRKGAELTAKFNLHINKLATATAAMLTADEGDKAAKQLEVDELQAQADGIDEETYQSLFLQFKACFKVHSFVPAEGHVKPTDPVTMKDIDWDNVDISLMQEAVGFFGTLTNS